MSPRKISPDEQLHMMHDVILSSINLKDGCLMRINPQTLNWNLGLCIFSRRDKKASKVNLLHPSNVKSHLLLLEAIFSSTEKGNLVLNVSLSDILENVSHVFAESQRQLEENGDDKNEKYTKSNFELYLKLREDNRLLYISYRDELGNVLAHSIEIKKDEFEVQFFTLGNITIDDLKISSIPFDLEFHNASFKLGNLVIREGDMFNTDPIKSANVLVVPCSTNGTTSANFVLRLSELGVSLPKPNHPGSISIHQSPIYNNVLVIYAYSVEYDRSNLGNINSICTEIRRILIDGIIELPVQVLGINIPLLGTGAGALDPTDVVEVFYQAFNNVGNDVPIILSIPSPELFSTIRRMYRKVAIPLVHQFQNFKPVAISFLEDELSIQIGPSHFEINFNGELIYLNLPGALLIKKEGILNQFTSLRSLGLEGAQIENLYFVQKMRRLQYLDLTKAKITNFEGLDLLPELISIELNGIENLNVQELIRCIVSVKRIGLANIDLKSISFITQLELLETVDLSYNRIVDIGPLSTLGNLVNIQISHNLVYDVTPLKNLPLLRYLDLSANRIKVIPDELLTSNLEYLRIDQNPFIALTDLHLFEGENHLSAFRNFVLRQQEKNKREIRLPAKVLLMGNHASGKSSLLRYLQDGKLSLSVKSTHIIQIERYPVNTHDLPDAIFYDFGGQDYYHGIYRAFLSGGAVNLILWNHETNSNSVRFDSENRLTQDFKLDYWLAQKMYMENERESGQISPVLLIQTYADKHQKQYYKLDADAYGIRNDFFVCLSNIKLYNKSHIAIVHDNALKYLKASIDSLIKENQVIRREPQWYIDFLVFIIKQSDVDDHSSKNVADLLPYYGRNVGNKIIYLKEDLHQLYRQGLILYYRDKMPNVVWLNPVALVNYVHKQLLSTEIIVKMKGRIPREEFTKYPPDIVDLLIKQKVISLHEHSDEYIIPNFLELANQNHPELELYTFGLGRPLFTMKFLNFLPFGLINQVICFFGELPKQKRFWRDRLIFTLDEKAKILININFKSLHIDVYASFTQDVTTQYKDDVTRFLFYGIMGLYWDLDLLRFHDFVAYTKGNLKKETYSPEDSMYTKIEATDNFYNNPNCRPIDLFISLNQIDFIKYKELCSDNTSVTIISYSMNEAGEFSGEAKSIPIFQYQPFTSYPLKRRNNVAISYSKKDLILVNKFKDYIRPLYDDELINHPWYCTELIAGTDWDQEIQRKFDSADIIFFMITENLMATKYVQENEIKNAIDKYNSGGKIKIVPILMHPYRFQRKGTYNLGKFSALPYTLEPVTSFDDENEAWYIISESIRIMIEKDLDPGKSDELPSELRKHFEKIVSRLNYKNRKTKKGFKIIDPPSSDPQVQERDTQ